MGGVRIVYDDQAGVFESRAGLPEEAAARVAAAVRACGELAADDLLVEVGAGTGVIGQWLAAPPGRYLGFDSSPAMLDVFRPRLRADDRASLVHADADRPWPVRTGAASVIFGSRVLHLLQPAHAASEAQRVAHPPGALLICGRVEHSPDSPRARARAKLRELLRAHGYRPGPTGGQPTRLLATAQAYGAQPFPPLVAAAWPEAVAVTQVIDWWRGKTSIGGTNPPPDVARAVLAGLDSWAAEAFPDPATPVTTETRYLLEGVRLAASTPGRGTGRDDPPSAKGGTT
jgi:hypothetical protein